jgi:hypothetical protein
MAFNRTVAYLCGDAVNQDLAQRWLGSDRVEITDDMTAVATCLVDADHLPFGRRLEEVLAALPASLTAVHGYNLDTKAGRELRFRGVRVFRRLTPRVLRRLLRMAAQPAEV